MASSTELWHYTNATKLVVMSADSKVSHSIGSQPIVDYLASGGVIGDPPVLSPAAVVEAALATGCAVESTEFTAINGIYRATPEVQVRLQGVVLYIQANGKFPAGLTTMPWVDAAGNVHEFPNTGIFLKFATAIGDYVVAVETSYLYLSSKLLAQPIQI